MRKLQLKATELVDTDVNFVSLVTRGANRIPFRITKEDEQMLDLHKIARSLFKTADPKPEIVAVIAQKGADQDKVLEVIKSAGLEPSEFTATEKDGILTFAKADADKAEGSLVVKVSDTVAMVVSGLQKAFEGFDFSSTNFGDVMASGSFCTSMCVATDMLSATIGNILAYADSPDTAADQIEKAVARAIKQDWDGSAKVLSKELQKFLEEVAEALAERHSGGWPGGDHGEHAVVANRRLGELIVKSVQCGWQHLRYDPGPDRRLGHRCRAGVRRHNHAEDREVPDRAAAGGPRRQGRAAEAERAGLAEHLRRPVEGRQSDHFPEAKGQIVPLYVLKNSVTIPPRLGMRKTLDAGIPYFVERAMDALVRKITKAADEKRQATYPRGDRDRLHRGRPARLAA